MITPLLRFALSSLRHELGRARFLALILVLFAVTLGPAISALAQADNAPAVPGVSSGEVSIVVDRFGVGTAARRGEWVGVRLTLSDSVEKPRNVVVRISSADPDGDTCVSERAIALNGQEKISPWLYHRLSFRSDGSDWRITVHEAAEGSTRDAAGRELPRLGAILGSLQVQARQRVINPVTGLIAIVGSKDYDLQRFAAQSNPSETWLPYGHERCEVVTGMSPAEFPDRWQGLAPFDVIVWGSGEPSELRTESRRAIREWIERGGHFIVILPSAGQTWTNENLSDLYDAMPLVSVRKNEDQDASPMKYLFTHKSRVRVPSKTTIHTFTPLPDVGPTDAMAVLNDTEDRTIVARRAVGAGDVTWIGVDLNQNPFSVDAIECDVFWNRILGRRGSTLTSDELRVGLPGNTNLNMPPSRSPVVFDAKIGNEVSKAKDSAAGMLLAFVVFVLYWLIAGPVGYGILKAKDLKRHAWLAFLAAAAVFTGIAWGGAMFLRPSKVEVRHVTILDHVFSQPVQRARMWASVLIPRYGDAPIKIGEPQEETRAGNSITAWESYDGDSTVSFPDSREYRTPIGDRTVLAVPARQTIKQVQVEWAGGPPWGMPLPQPVPGATEAARIRLLNEGRWEKDTPILEGVLRHKLPAPLTNVTVIVIRGQSPIRRFAPASFAARRDELIADGYAFAYNDKWPADSDLDLGVLTRQSQLPSLSALLTQLRPAGSMLGFDTTEYIASTDFFSQMKSLSLFHMLPPPTEDPQGNYVFAAQRYYTHGMDLSMWMTHPCVIIIGELGSNENPVPGPIPLSVDGESVVPMGQTIVRWVYPLPSNPPDFAQKFDPTQPGLPSFNEPRAGESLSPAGDGQ